MITTMEIKRKTCWPLLEGAATNTYFFLFEEDFAVDNVRCIPMIVRFKLDACGIKLKLNEWSRFNVTERNNLVRTECITDDDIVWYRNYLQQLVVKYHGRLPAELSIDAFPCWDNTNRLPEELGEMMSVFNCNISLQQWQSLNHLQRFALLKLCRPGHENKNFPAAAKEFGLM